MLILIEIVQNVLQWNFIPVLTASSPHIYGANIIPDIVSIFRYLCFPIHHFIQYLFGHAILLKF